MMEERHYVVSGYKADELRQGQPASSFARHAWGVRIASTRGEALSGQESFFTGLFPRASYFTSHEDMLVVYYDRPEPELENAMRLYEEDFYNELSVFLLPRVKTVHAEAMRDLVGLYLEAFGDTPGVYTLREVANRFRLDGKDEALARLARLSFLSFADPVGMKDALLAMADCDLNASKAAASCYLHRNTLMNRLDQIEEALLLSPRRFRDEEALCLLTGRLS